MRNPLVSHNLGVSKRMGFETPKLRDRFGGGFATPRVGNNAEMGSEVVDPTTETLNAYERHSAQYIERTSTARSPLVDVLIELTNSGDRVLELGSGPGRDAADLESAGLVVERTDGASSFVDRLNAAGHTARVLSFYDEDFGGPYDAVFANAVLLHVSRTRLTSVLKVARRAACDGGLLVASFKKGTGQAWSEQKLDARRHFTYWEEDDLRPIVAAAGWIPVSIADTTRPTSAERWLTLIARTDNAC